MESEVQPRYSAEAAVLFCASFIQLHHKISVELSNADGVGRMLTWLITHLSSETDDANTVSLQQSGRVSRSRRMYGPHRVKAFFYSSTTVRSTEIVVTKSQSGETARGWNVDMPRARRYYGNTRYQISDQVGATMSVEEPASIIALG